MNRALCIGMLIISAGCTLPPERAPLKPLTEDSPPVTYIELLNRARTQATSATEAFYVDGWTELEELARGLEQTCRFLPKATEVPAKQQAHLKEKSSTLEAESRRLQEAAKAHDEKKTNECLQKINLLVREFRADG
jgi:hypothetical protein